MKFSMNNNRQQHTQYCELCGVVISGKTYHDVRSSGALRGRGKVLCSKCFGVLLKMPAEEALEALNKSSSNTSKS